MTRGGGECERAKYAMPIGKEKIFALAKGFRGRAKNCIKIARSRVEKSLQHAYRGRKEKKRDWRTLWIARINAATREHAVSLHGTEAGRKVCCMYLMCTPSMQMSYSRFMHGLATQNVLMNRKVISELAMSEPFSFKALVDQVGGAEGASSSISIFSESNPQPFPPLPGQVHARDEWCRHCQWDTRTAAENRRQAVRLKAFTHQPV